MATLSDGMTEDVSGSVTWTSSNMGVVTITSGGLAKGVAVGSVTIQATANGGVVGSAVLQVTVATVVSIGVRGASASIAKGATDQFTAVATLTDGSTEDLTGSVTWTSLNTAVVTITASGLAQGVGTGSATIQAASGTVNGTTTLMVTAATLVSISVTDVSPSIPDGSTDQFTAIGKFSDGTMQNITATVTWTSLNTGVATIAANGLAKGIGVGNVSIQAALGNINSAITLGVTAPVLTSISVTAASVSIPKGTTDQFTAMGTFTDGSTQNITSTITWSSLNTGIATIVAGGLATGVGIGSATIQAASGGITGTKTLGVTAAALASISVTAANASIPKGTTDQFTATGTFTDGSMQNITRTVTWSSLNTGIVTISAGGLATGVGIGSATIQAASGSITGTTTFSVTAAALASINVTAPNQTIASGTTEQFAATGIFTDNSTQDLTASVTWNSTNMSVATIAAGGLASAVGNGMTMIQATQAGVQGSFNLTVTAISLAVLVVGPQNPVIADAGVTQAFTATGHFSDGSTLDLTSSAIWTSSNTNVATMSGAMATSQTLAAGATAGFSSIQAMVGTTTGVAILSVTNHTGNGFAGMFTQHNDISRTGLNANENVLTTTNVGSTTTFGKKFSHAVDGYIYAQPLYVPNVGIGGVAHNVVIVATEGDSVYAFDADNNTGANANPLWHASLIDTSHGATTGEQTVNSFSDVNCSDLIPQVGTTSTPVIEPGTGTIYVEAKSKQPAGPQFFQRLHALDISTGNEKLGGPAVIAGSVPIPGGGSVTFIPLNQHNRPGLLWVNGVIYVAFASHCDGTTPYYGWVFAYNATTMSQVAIWNDTLTSTSSRGGLGGIWMSGSGIAADSAANVFLSTGNGEFDAVNVPATELGDSNVKLFYNGTATFSLLDYFTPFDQLNLEQSDTDLGSGGVLLLPDQSGGHPHEFIQSGKGGAIRLIDRDQMTTANEHYCPPTTCPNGDPEIVQEIGGAVSSVYSTPAYWNNNVYFCGFGDAVEEFSLANGMLSTSPSFSSAHGFGFPGCTPSVSANGSSNGIVWAIDSSNYGPPAQTTAGPAVLYALRGDTLAELWDSSQAAGNRDQAGNAVKFSVPTVANGKVYVGTATELDVYGTLP